MSSKLAINTAKLAIEGGPPVRSTFLPYATQTVDEDDRAAVDAVLRGGWLTTGPAVRAFEQALCGYTGAGHAVAVSSGTAALHASTFCADIRPGDEVIVPALSFVASANCVLYQGGVPVFADVCPDTLNIDPEEVERRITPRTKAIVTVDFAGHPIDHAAIREIAEQHGLIVISDSSHSLGSTYRDKNTGTLQDLNVLSFHPVKLITSGEGGALLSDNPELAKRAASFRHHGIDLDLHARNSAQSWVYDVVSLGFNYRIPDTNCALATNQLSKLPKWLSRRRELVEFYGRHLKMNPMVELPAERPDCESSWHLYVIRLKLDTINATRAEVFQALRAENIGVNVHYIPIPWMSYYASLGYEKGHWQVAESEYERMLSIPIYPRMTDADAQDVVDALEKVYDRFKR